MLLKRLEEHPEDFNELVLDRTRWSGLLRQVEIKGTFVEQVVLRRVKHKSFKKAERAALLGAIVKQTIDPAPEVAEDEVMYVGTGVGNPAQIAAQQHIQLHKLYQQQMAMNAAQGINYGAGGVGGMGANLLGTTSTTSTYTQP
jgi:hypothetical protein